MFPLHHWIAHKHCTAGLGSPRIMTTELKDGNPITPDAAVDGAGIWGRFQELPLEQAEEALVMPEKL